MGRSPRLLAVALLCLFGLGGGLFGEAQLTHASLFDLLQPGSRFAAGWGSDPFLSPIDDQAGWWQTPLLHEGRAFRLEWTSQQPVTPLATGQRGALGRTASGLRVVGTRRWETTTAHAGIAWSQPRWSADWGGSSGGMELSSESSRFECAARVTELPGGTTIQGIASSQGPNGAKSRFRGFGLGLRCRPADFLSVQGHWSTESQQPELSCNLHDSPWNARIDLCRRNQALAGRIEPGFGFQLEGSIRRAFYDPGSELGPALRYEMTPAGEDRLTQASLSWNAGDALSCLLRRTDYWADLEGEAFWGGQRFGHLNYVHAEMRSYLLALQARPNPDSRYLLEVERVDGKGKSRAVVEFWPFTPTMIDLLGMRRTYRARIEGHWLRSRLAGEWKIGSRFSARAGLGYWDLYPDIAIDSWQPVFLVFGCTDLRSKRPSIRRVQMAAVALGGQMSVGGLEFALHIQQVILATAHHVRDTEIGGDSSASDPADVTGWKTPSDSSWPGGSQMQFQIVRRF
ncbi:MAG: hypothetical protein KAY32_06560 [Candidatus Eisenbacteria sp.]|nr:hypothetical protein [Candidatus Eisenbacteria bacterium]